MISKMLDLKFMEDANLKINILNFLFFLVGFSIPISYAVNSISMAVLFAYSFIFFNKKNYTSILEKGFVIHVLFVTYFLLQFLGVFYSANQEVGFSYVLKNIVFLMLPITFINLQNALSPRNLKLGVLGLFLSVLLILSSIYSKIITDMFSNKLDISALLYRFVRVNFVSKGFVQIHPPYFGLLVVFSIVFVLHIKISTHRIYNYFLKFIIVAFLLMALYGISSFMSVILLSVMFLGYVIYLISQGFFKQMMILFLTVILLVVIFIKFDGTALLLKSPGTSLLGRIEWSFVKGKGDTSRPDNWKSVYQVIKQHPLLGVGSDGGINQLQKYRPENSESFRDKHNAHNQYLETCLRHGLIGLMLYLVILGSLVKLAIKSKDIIFGSFIFIFVLASMTESFLVRQIGLTFFIFYALLFSTFYSFEFYKERNVK